MKILLYFIAVLPAILIIGFVYWQDRIQKEATLPLVITFALGMVSALPAIGIQMLASRYGFNESEPLWILLFNVFVVVAFSEELVKLLMVLAYPFRQSFFDEKLDGIVYTVMVGMGFAVVENIIYAYNFGIETTLVRAFTAVPAHGIFAIFMGYFLGLAKFHPDQKVKLIFVGFWLAVLIHGFYDFFILQQYYDWLMIGGVLMVIIGSYLSWQLIKDHKKTEQPPKPGNLV